MPRFLVFRKSKRRVRITNSKPFRNPYHEILFVTPSRNGSRCPGKRPANKPKVAEVGLWACGAESVEPRDGRGEHGRATHVPDTEPGKRVQGLERWTRACKAAGCGSS